MPKPTATKRKVGRRTKLTPKLQAQVVKLLVAGNYVSTACAHVGIDQATYYRWMDESKSPEKEFCEFRKAVAEASAQAEVAALKEVRAQKKDIWFLEHRFPRRWGSKIEHEHTGKKGGPIQHDVTFRGSPEEFERAVEAITGEEDPNEEDTLPGDPADD